MRGDSRDRVRQALDELKPYLSSYVVQALNGTSRARRPNGSDTAALLASLVENWDLVFAGVLPKVVRTYVFELRDVRNRWAHEEPFTDDEARRAVDTARMLAKAIGAPPTLAAALMALASTGLTAPSSSATEPMTAGSLSSRDSSMRSSGSPATARRVTQRDVMRAIWARCAPDEARAILEYAETERRGEAPRARNASKYSPEQYARALLADGLKKGWLRRER